MGLKNILASTGLVEFDEKKSTEGPALTNEFRVLPKKEAKAVTVDTSKFSAHFDTLLKEANLPGPDYYEFMTTLDGLKAFIPDEKNRILAAYTTLKAQGLTKEILLQSAGQYVDLVVNDKKKFEGAIEKKEENEIGGRRQQVTEISKSIDENVEQIKKLTELNVELQTKMNALKAEISEIETSIHLNHQAFVEACDAMATKIQNDISIIKENL